MYTETNDSRFTSEAEIGFGFKIGATATVPYWATGLEGVIFEIEEVAISTGLFETNTKWRATGRCDANNPYDATSLGANINIGSKVNYGGPTIKFPDPTTPIYPG